MIKEILKKAVFVCIVLIITIINNDTFTNNLASVAIIMLVVSLFSVLSQMGSYDSVYYRFGSFYASIRKKETEGEKKYESFERYKKYLSEHRDGIVWYNIVFYIVIILITFII